MLVFIKHFLNFTKKEIQEMSFSEIEMWYSEAVKLFRKMNFPPEVKGNK